MANQKSDPIAKAAAAQKRQLAWDTFKEGNPEEYLRIKAEREAKKNGGQTN